MARSLPVRVATAVVSLGLAATAAVWAATYRELHVSTVGFGNGSYSIMWERATPAWAAPVAAAIAFTGLVAAFLALRRR
jgi:hypothetical protein